MTSQALISKIHRKLSANQEGHCIAQEEANVSVCGLARQFSMPGQGTLNKGEIMCTENDGTGQ